MSSTPRLMATACLSKLRRVIHDSGPYSLIDAHYFYPDGVAAAMLARKLGLPYVITARGSDINLIADYDSPRRQILRAAQGAAALIAVSEALADKMRSLGMPDEKIVVLRNGVDLNFFSPGDRDTARESLGLDDIVLLYVGELKKAKGQEHAIRLIAEIDNAQLIIAGRGSDDHAYRSLAESLGVSARVRFTGTLSPTELRDYYRAADVLLLISEREGTPNVILESMACGTPVIASAVGGIPSLLADGGVGQLVNDRSLAGLRSAWHKHLAQPVNPAHIRRIAEGFSWPATVAGLHKTMMQAAA
jgi:glycosyltransferase involved in cell wall biosynthesis